MATVTTSTTSQTTTAVGVASAPMAAGTGDPLVTFQGLSRSFRTKHGVVTALDNVDLTIHRGEFVCIVGPSGCGKTTMLNILGSLDAPTSGTVKVAPPQKSRPPFSIVFQEQGVYPWMSVLDNTAFGLAVRGVSKSERYAVARDLLHRMGLDRFEHSYPRELSGGMRQRVNLARAFANDPEMLLMDEPFASLDEQTKLLLQDDLLQVWEGTRKTVLFITHSLEEAIRLADRVVVMTARPGRIKAIIPVNLPRPRDVFDMPSNEEYLHLHATVWQYLREEVLAARGIDSERRG